ncbi:hypothetical protein [Saccharothrix lopnurensis]|uniref:Sensory transduction regulator n=1 Tax=Saccharothrix lopnurensis TaxID=1670621 RepID=A0ABW1NXQ8_9PSEU
MGKGSRLKKQRRTSQNQRAHRGTDLLASPRPPKPIELADGTDPVAALRSMLLGRGWVEEPPDGVLAQMWFEFPQSLIDFAPRGAADPDGIHPTVVLVCARSSEAGGYLRDFEIHVDMAGRDRDLACPEHAAPPERNFSLDTAGLTQLAGQLDGIEQHVARWPEMIACADGPGACE